MRALRSLERGMVVVISFHLDVAAVLHPVFSSSLPSTEPSGYVPGFISLSFVPSIRFSCILLEQIESRRSLGVVVGHLVAEASGKLMKGVMTLRGYGAISDNRIPGVENARTAAVGSVIVVGIVSVSSPLFLIISASVLISFRIPSLQLFAMSCTVACLK